MRGACIPFWLLALTILPSACDSRSDASSDAPATGSQTFLVGPPPDGRIGDVRFRLRVPRAYLPPRLRAEQVEDIRTNRVLFTVRVGDFTPAGEIPADQPGVVQGGISWGSEGFVRRSVDGSWLNHFSQYSVPLGTRYGLEARTVEEAEYFPAELYVSLSKEQAVAIECDYLAGNRPQFCRLSSQRPGGPLIQIGLREDYLPRWRSMTERAHLLVERWAASAEMSNAASLTGSGDIETAPVMTNKATRSTK